MPVDPSIQVLLDSMAGSDTPDLSDMSVPDARAMMAMLTVVDGEPEPVDDVTDPDDPRARGRHPGAHLPQRRARAAAGAGLVPRRRLGDRRPRERRPDLTQAGQPIRRGRRVGRLPAGPRAPVPRRGRTTAGPRSSGWRPTRPSIGGDPDRLAVGGDSAGGNLAAVVAVKASQSGGPALRHQLLVYPAVDLTASFPSIDSNGEGYLLTKKSMLWFMDHYLGDGATRKDPLVSPAVRRRPLRRGSGHRVHRRVRPAARRGRGLRGAPLRVRRRLRLPLLRRHDPRLLRHGRPSPRSPSRPWTRPAPASAPPSPSRPLPPFRNWASAYSESDGFHAQFAGVGRRAQSLKAGRTSRPISSIDCITLSWGILNGLTRQSSRSQPAAS